MPIIPTFILRASALVLITMASSFGAFGQDGDTFYDQQSAPDERQCYRPAPPFREDYDTFDEFNVERENYYRQSSFYISCIDQWIEDARRTYLDMYHMEASTYLEERNEILDELRTIGKDDLE